MSEEEKKAIEYIQILIKGYIQKIKKLENFDKYKEESDFLKISVQHYNKLLNLIQNQQQELQLKDKVIDEMVKDIIRMDKFIDGAGYYGEFAIKTKEYVLNSYINKVKGE